MKKIILLNWKMNPSTTEQAKKLAKAVRLLAKTVREDVVVFPPSLFVSVVQSVLKKESSVSIGIQNCAYEENKGKMTGEISPAMASSMGVGYVLVGHSERRYKMGETDTMIRAKIALAQRSGLTPILCVGEKKKTSIHRAKEQVIRQLFFDTKDVVPRRPLIVAYEPVWAIGGNKEVDIAHARMMIEEIQAVLKRRIAIKVPVVYGGSVHPNIAKEFLRHTGARGLLVGSASLDENQLEQFANVLR